MIVKLIQQRKKEANVITLKKLYKVLLMFVFSYFNIKNYTNITNFNFFIG
jgi:hypothetical protein